MAAAPRTYLSETGDRRFGALEGDAGLRFFVDDSGRGAGAGFTEFLEPGKKHDRGGGVRNRIIGYFH